VLRGALTVLRPATDDDTPLLARWHADPEVSRYWDDETYTVEELHEEGVEPWIVEADGEPIGFVQSWVDETAAPGSGIDLFLIPSARGRGLGPDAGRTLALHLLGRGWPEVHVDPYLWNEAAVRAWERAGFEPVEEREPDEWRKHRWLLMRFAATLDAC
jgi:aminoglycoside 6'-N-acetyltransferase